MKCRNVGKRSAMAQRAAQCATRKGKRMKKKLLFVCLLGAIILVCCFFRFSGTTEDCRLSLNREDIPYVMQEGRRYVFLEDILKNGFVLEPFSGGYQDDKTVYRYVLWTSSLLEAPDDVLITKPEIAKMPADIRGEIYINGLQIGCYELQGRPMVSLEEFAALPKEAIKEQEGAEPQTAILFDREGNQTILEDKVVQVSEFACQTLDGNPEPEGTFGFQSCSPYFVKNKVKRGTVSLQTVESGDTVETEDGEFLLKKVLAGERKGLREIELMDDYMNFSKVLDALGLSANMKNGTLHIDGHGKMRTFYADKPDSVGTLHYCKERVFKIECKDKSGDDLDCLLMKDALYVSMEDVKTKELLAEKGIAYNDYKWFPIRPSKGQ